MPGIKPSSPGVRLATLGLKPGSPDEAATVNPNLRATGEILTYVDGVPVYASENKLDGDIDVKIRDDIVGSDQISGNGKCGDLTRTVLSEQTSTVIPGLGSVYELQLNEYEHADERAIVPRESGEIEEVPMKSGTNQIMQLHLNVPVKTPLQQLHDLVTYNVTPIDEDLLRQNPMEDEGEDESKVENFKKVVREGDLSPTASAKGVALMEPFQKKGLIDRYKMRLNMETAYAKIWLFFDAVVEWELVEDTEQQDIIGADIHNMVLHFYGGAALPKSITHTNLVLLPKKPRVETFSDLRPISLSNFINKVLSRALHDRLENFLPSLIASNQSEFVKGRSIFENILLTQEIVTDIRLRGKPANVVIKLNMDKAYDRVSWKYLFILGHLHKTFARFFWSTKEEGRSRHWASWQNLCLRKEEGGLGFMSLNDVSRALFAKLWWRFRTTKSLWSNFMWNKYCKKELPTVVHLRGGSHVWRQMLNARKEVEYEIVWELKSGTTNIWHENWTGLGALYHVLPEDFPINEGLQKVVELRQGEA
ncbi:uncharacterized protein [Nicotiana tomentosiformis]|uniref:uncharacterized protein n=1 Tax=Nicotiana tomentosiformis TaxID=4098 RepID=UPI00388C883C